MKQLSIHERKQIAHDEGNCPDVCDLCAEEKREMADDRRKAEREDGKTEG